MGKGLNKLAESKCASNPFVACILTIKISIFQMNDLVAHGHLHEKKHFLRRRCRHQKAIGELPCPVTGFVLKHER